MRYGIQIVYPLIAPLFRHANVRPLSMSLVIMRIAPNGKRRCQLSCTVPALTKLTAEDSMNLICGSAA